MSKWFYKNKKIDRELSNKLGIHPAIIKILADRGVETECIERSKFLQRFLDYQ